MNINKQILMTFAILMVQFTCSTISEDEETKLESIDEHFALDTNSTYPEAIIHKYQTLYKRRLEAKRSLQKETKNSKKNSKHEYSYLAQRRNVTFSKWDLADQNKPNYEEKSNSLTPVETGTTMNIEHQARNLKGNGHEFFSRANEEIDSWDNNHENPLTNLDSGIGMKTFDKFESKIFRDFIKKKNKNERSALEQIYKILGTNIGKVPVPAIPVSEDGFRVLIALGINPFHLNKPVNPQIIENIHIAYKELISLIEVDIQSNIFPLVFYQTVSPIIKEKLLPLLEVVIVDKDRKFPGLFIILGDLIEIPEDLEKDGYTISNFFRVIDKDFNERLVNDNERNMILVKYYKRNVERIQELLDEDWKESKAPVNFIKYISDYFRMEKFLVIGKFFYQMLTQKLERNDRLEVKNFERFLKFSELSRKDEL